MSFSIVIDDRMWAMIACHKKRPMEVSYTHRLICEQVAGVLPDVLKQRENPEEYKKVVQSYKDLLVSNAQTSGILEGLGSAAENLYQYGKSNWCSSGISRPNEINWSYSI